MSLSEIKTPYIMYSFMSLSEIKTPYIMYSFMSLSEIKLYIIYIMRLLYILTSGRAPRRKMGFLGASSQRHRQQNKNEIKNKYKRHTGAHNNK